MTKARKVEVDATADADEPRRPISLDEILMRFHRRLSNRYRRWRFCGEPLCRRQRTCMGDARTCSSDGRPKPVRTPEESAKIMADLYKDVKRLSAERRAQAEIAAMQQVTPKPAARKRGRRDGAGASR